MNNPVDPPILDRQGLEVLSADQCWQLLEEATVGRIAFIDAGDPMILPVTFRVDGRSIVFRTGTGAKLHAALVATPVAFEIDGWDEPGRTGWSVLLRGVADTVHDSLELGRLNELGLEPWADAVDRSHWIRLRPDEITGRRIV